MLAKGIRLYLAFSRNLLQALGVYLNFKNFTITKRAKEKLDLRWFTKFICNDFEIFI